MNFEQYKELLEGRVNDLNINPYLLSFSVEDKRLVAFKDGRVLVHGTKDISEAKQFIIAILDRKDEWDESE